MINQRRYVLGQEVWIYDRYRMAIPVRGVIEQFHEASGSVRLRLVTTNDAASWPVGRADFWVHEHQLSARGPLEGREKAAAEILNNAFDSTYTGVARQQTAHERQVGGTYYKQAKLQPWDVIQAWNLDFWLGNAVKYIFRAATGVKEDPVLNLEKGQHYMEKKIELAKEVKGFDQDSDAGGWTPPS